jgi:cytochrome c oxidase cbb3-type subunit III
MAEENINQHQHDSGSHEYDGIKELTNPAPYWIMLLFIATIGFSVFYVIQYFGYPGNKKDQASEYIRDSASLVASLTKDSTKATSASKLDEKSMLAEGANLFNTKGCIACHGMNGEGNAIGPNLTDNFWLNGCKEENLIKIITEGKPEKGMTSFKTTMTADQIKTVTNYILKTLVGTKPANSKAPQGDECK